MDYAKLPLRLLEQERTSTLLRLEREKKELKRIDDAITEKKRESNMEAPA